jgi:integrase
MSFLEEQAERLLRFVDPGHVVGDQPLGLRDGALLAVLAAGVTPAEAAQLRASDITLDHGILRVRLPRPRSRKPVFLSLPTPLGARLLAWLSDRRLWGSEQPVFPCVHGPLTQEGIYTLLRRYRRLQRGKR